MSKKKQNGPKLIVAAAAILGVAAIVYWTLSDRNVTAQLAGNIPLAGIVGPSCSVSVTALPAASNLNLTGGAVVDLQVGTVTQNCNASAGYTLTVTSANCDVTNGAKVVRNGSPTDLLEYAVEFHNPATGGSATEVTDLLATACANQIGRSVTGTAIFAEQSQVYLNYTGSASLAAGTYQDTLTITMTTN